MTFEQLKEQGEIASEQGNQEQALIAMDRAFIMALSEKNYAGAINILGHHLHVYKVYFQKTGDPSFMELFYSDVLAGLRLADLNKIEGQPKSVMYLRSGDYFLFKQDYQQSAAQYKLAVKELNKTSQESQEIYAEYLGHYAIALIKAGDDSGFSKFEEALKIIRSNNTIRPFHHLIIESGILLRQADAYNHVGKIDQAEESLATAKVLADELASKHNMKMRQQQARKLAQAIATAPKN